MNILSVMNSTMNEQIYTSIKNNNIENFIFLLDSINNNNDKKELLLKKMYFTNIVNDKKEYTILSLILNLNRIELLELIYNQFGFVGNFNYYNILFKDVFYSSFQIKKRLKILEFLIEKKYVYSKQSEQQLQCISNYQGRFLDSFKYINKIKINNLTTPLHMFTLYKNINIIKPYIDFFIYNSIYNIDIVDIYNKNALLYASELLLFDYCKLLIELDSDIYHTDIYECNLFHYLLLQENTQTNTEIIIKLIKFILEFKINNFDSIYRLLYMKNIRQLTPIDYILSKGKYNIFVYLEKNNLVRYDSKYITSVTDGYKNYYNIIEKHNKNIENSYQFRSYIDLTQLLLKNCMNFKKQDYLNSSIKNLPKMRQLLQ